MGSSIEFFERQFRKQVDARDLALNPFEQAALPFLRGRVLDFGCGLGNLALAAARAGCSVEAFDGAPTAIRHLAETAAREQLALRAVEADLRAFPASGSFDAVVCIGLLMFFDCDAARRQLANLQACVRPGGTAVINVLIRGTSYLEMFDGENRCLFERDELHERFAGWEILDESFAEFPAPGDTLKSFATLIARKPAGETLAN